MSHEFVGHPLLDEVPEGKIDINQILDKNKALISIFPGSRTSEIKILMPILLEFINLMNKNYEDFIYIFHTTKEHSNLIKSYIQNNGIENYEIISDEKMKTHLLKKSVFAVAKSGTVSLEICKSKIPSIIIYKMNFINYFIVKSLVKIKFANIINIAANKEIIQNYYNQNVMPKIYLKMFAHLLMIPKK